MVKKWPKNMGFGLFKKIMSLVLSGICVKRKFLWFITAMCGTDNYKTRLKKYNVHCC